MSYITIIHINEHYEFYEEELLNAPNSMRYAYVLLDRDTGKEFVLYHADKADYSNAPFDKIIKLWISLG